MIEPDTAHDFKHDSAPDGATVAASDAVQALAMVGDLTMGQPPGHSMRTARLAARVAQADGLAPGGVADAHLVALLRWSGATASAAGFAALTGDDVGGRNAMLTRTLPAGHALTPAGVLPLVQVHCEIAGDIARTLGLPAAVEQGLRRVFERVDGSGMPARLHGDDIPAVVFYAALAGDLEILSRAHGLDTALRLVGQLAGRKYPAALVERIVPHARGWLADADNDADNDEAAGPPPIAGADVSLALVADTLELKLPWLAGYSRRVAGLAQSAAALAGMPAAQQQCLARAALLHGIGRAAIPNPVWQRRGPLRSAEWEQVRRVPYWTARLATHVPALGAEAQLASHAYERLDGSGYFRRLPHDALGPAQRLLAAAAAWTALCAPRPWRAAYDPAAATALLAAQGTRFDRHAVDAVIAAAAQPALPRRGGVLSDREVQVLRTIGGCASGREAARVLRISTGAVRTHVDSILEKLACSTRAAATLKALTLGLI
ncbi:MAG TPA: HD domain-containing phosphohydrolase [Pseudoduganella sp.]|jgi:HD-GYP domain-containing protein (c-di-GMP phosphodiesterase class II)